MSKSIWQNLHAKTSKKLTSSLEGEICVVGAGIAGLTSAYKLVKGGKRVVLVHAGSLSHGETSKSTAQINTVHDDGWAEMLDLHGEENLRLCYLSYQHAFDFIKGTIQEHNFNCGYEPISSFLFTYDKEEGQKWVDKEFEAATQIGFNGIHKAKHTPLTHYQTCPALLYDHQAQFQPLAYQNELMKYLFASGLCEFYSDTHIKDIREEASLVSLISNEDIEIKAQKVILATNVPIHRKLIPIEALAPYRSYVVALKVGRGAIPHFQYWDNLDPYHYVRLLGKAGEVNHGAELEDKDTEILIVGGEDHRVGEVTDIKIHYDRLKTWAQKYFPIVGDTGLRWSAQTVETFDGMPLIGACSHNNNIFIITGDSGTGITHGTVGGLLVANKLLGIDSQWEHLYDPMRSRINSMKRWASENLTGASSYSDWFTTGEVSSEKDIPLGEGAIIRNGLSKTAVFHDKDGKFIRLSAVCPHLGAIVRWNTVEKSWDCPAHGSRFSPSGHVLNGPANCNLCLDKDNT